MCMKRLGVKRGSEQSTKKISFSVVSTAHGENNWGIWLIFVSVHVVRDVPKIGVLLGVEVGKTGGKTLFLC